MASPRLNRLGIYVARIWVPTDLQIALGKKEVVRSLRTRDPGEAKRLFKQVAAEFEDEWDRLRTAARLAPPPDRNAPEPRVISEKEAHALAGEFYRRLIADHEDNPGSPEIWSKQLTAAQRMLPKHERIPGVAVAFVDDNGYAFHPARNAFYTLSKEVRAFLDERDDNLEPTSFVRLCTKVALAKRDAYEQLQRNARGDFRADQKADRFPALPDRVEGRGAGSDGSAVDCKALIARWKETTDLAARTHKAWSGKLRMLMKFAGKTDVAALTRNDVERWRDHRIDQGVKPKTVSWGDLAGVRGILRWATMHSDFPQITENVAAGVSQPVSKKKVRLREKGFTHAEAMKILEGALVPLSDDFTEAGRGARRWVPWLCCYSGARIGEIAQMHSSRIFKEQLPNGRWYWCMRITPEDGTVKDHEARTLPLHSHIVEQGFIEYAQRRQKARKPLFFEPELGKGGSRQAERVGQRIANWVRDDLKITGVMPNHGWRHRFETLARNLDLRMDVANYITGHAGADVAAEYGDYLIEALANAIEKLPRYEIA